MSEEKEVNADIEPSKKRQDQGDETAKGNDVFRFLERFYKLYRTDFFQGLDGEYYISIDSGSLVSTFKIGKNLCTDFFIGLIRKFGLGGGRSRDLATRIGDEFYGMAIEKSSKQKVNVRVGRSGESILIDLGTADGSIVMIQPGQDFIITKKPAIPFFRPSNQLPLPFPEKIELSDFQSLWNRTFKFRNEYGNELLLAYVVHSLIPDNGSYPILLIEGPQGTGKTTTSLRIKSIIDPTFPLLQGMNKSEDDVCINLFTSYLLAYDNLSFITPEMSDVFSRISTGGGLTKRMLYKADELKVFNVKAPVLFNGIQELTDRPDFMDRAITLTMKQINIHEKIADTVMQKTFETDLPKLLGGIYQLVSEVMAIMDEMPLDGLPRMGDFTRVGLALDKVLKRSGPSFLEIYSAHLEEKVELSFANSPFCQRLVTCLAKDDYLEGSITDLFRKICSYDRTQYREGLPKGPKGLRGALERHRDILNANGIEFGELPRTASARGLFIKLSNASSPPRVESHEGLLG